ncbi:DUF1797 family protein [Limosilactobacillus frumenti]|uniref:DUF1797 family protein n=1 Tax=Limosilactobacillus frumenti TaxID=104955 RepID=UPI00070F1A3C|nr:DUF1797 family protein [Limosilactobacillus frumenti]MBA2914661.1 DUF1797 family protein [Limosilactobacillus frumenti]QFG72918.1 DUF1797 family protein [Limosilactobacillus frumenti]
MEESTLEVIIRRLHAMMRDQSSDFQKRIFEQFGIPVCEVRYSRVGDEFTFIRYRPRERFRFDDLDLVAIEVFNSLYDLKHTF